VSGSALVTGGGGFLGRYIVEGLLARGTRVRVFSRQDYPDLRALGVEVRRGDLRDAAAVAEAVAGTEAVLHAAALPGIWGPWRTYYEINTLGTQHVLEACRRHGVRRLIYTSSPSVVYDGKAHVNADESLPYPAQHLCHYPHSKSLAEQAVLAAHDPGGLQTIALRPHLIWGPRDGHLIPRLIARARQGRLVRVGDGRNLVSVSYVENTAAAHLQALDALIAGRPCGGRAYFINEPEPVRLWGWIDEILALGGLPPVRRSLPTGAAWSLGAICEALYGLGRISAEPPLTRFLASQLSQSHCYSIENARRDWGYEPPVSFAEGMRRLAPLVQELSDAS
jgi:nucleoside-diphosphate-sugar epimerase